MGAADLSASVHAAAETVWRMESGRVIAGLTHLVNDVGLAEELAQDALVLALEQWPRDGVPDNPGAWLMATAKHRAIDRLRRRTRYEEKLREIGFAQVEPGEPELDHVGDDLLTLIFMACHPDLPVPSRVALTLRLLGGLTTVETARALLVPEATVAQRIVRAKKALVGVRFELPEPPEMARRLASVLEVVYLIFNEGYSATSGDDWMRPDLCAEALRLGRVLAGLAPAEPEVHGLLALMEIQASRTRARTGPDGAPVLLLDQDRRLWDRLLIRRGVAALAEAERLSLGGPGPYTLDSFQFGQAKLESFQFGRSSIMESFQFGRSGPGPYALQAAIAACHARAASAEETDWARIAGLYAVLGKVSPSPVVELNRAVAVGRAEGPERGLAVVDAVRSERALAGYALLPAVRADLLAQLGRESEARAEFELAASLTRNERERSILLRRVAELDPRVG